MNQSNEKSIKTNWEQYEEKLAEIHKLELQNKEMERKNAINYSKAFQLQKNDAANASTIESGQRKLDELDKFYIFLTNQMEQLESLLESSESSNLFSLDNMGDPLNSQFFLDDNNLYPPF